MFSQSVKCEKNTPVYENAPLMLWTATHMRAGLDDLRRSLIFVLLEVLHEELAELLDLSLEVGSAVP